MGLKNLIKIVKCKIFICCKSSCSINDTNGDGIPDTVKIEYELDKETEEKMKEQREKYFKEVF
tara:strand:+ start:242 stop:430 length:189 start_codon:yes stop_codon:yes gene_type:complete